MPVLNFSREGAGEPLVVMHGLFGSSRNWQTLARRFAGHFDVVNVDLRNHGQSFHDDEMSYPAMAADLLELMRALGLGRAHLLGHSMGGKVAMTLAVNHPGLAGRLVIADIAPVSYFHHYDDLIEPILSLPLDQIESRTQADHMLRPNIPEDSLRVFLMQNLVRQADSWQWRVNWRTIQRDMEYLTGFDELPSAWRIDLPTLFIRGARSDYIGDSEISEIRQRFSDVDIVTIEDAGHWLHAEKPEEFADRVLAFI